MKIVIITGQTATGKTNFAIKYAKKLNGKIINSDSRQIYKFLDIVTGKELSNNIYLNDIVYPDQYFSSFDYQQKAIEVIKKILSEGKTPILVGGTYFYLYHLLYDVDTQNMPPDFKLRRKLEDQSVPELQQILKTKNVQLFNQLNNSDRYNPRRLIRKIEISIQPRRLSSALRQSNGEKLITLGNKLHIRNLEIKFIGLKFKSKEKLKERIETRVENRVKKGAIEETRKLLKKGYKETDPGLKTIGYRQLIKYLKGKVTRDEAINEWKTKEIQYAKRQLTFMIKDKNIIWQEI